MPNLNIFLPNCQVNFAKIFSLREIGIPSIRSPIHHLNSILFWKTIPPTTYNTNTHIINSLFMKLTFGECLCHFSIYSLDFPNLSLRQFFIYITANSPFLSNKVTLICTIIFIVSMCSQNNTILLSKIFAIPI